VKDSCLGVEPSTGHPVVENGEFLEACLRGFHEMSKNLVVTDETVVFCDTGVCPFLEQRGIFAVEDNAGVVEAKRAAHGKFILIQKIEDWL